MSKNWANELEDRVSWITELLIKSNQKGIIFANSGGKDCSLAGILCRKATPKVLSLIMPCQSSRNYTTDRDHAILLSKTQDIPTLEIDLTEAKELLTRLTTAPKGALPSWADQTPIITSPALTNINPRLRMLTLYAYAQSLGLLVAGTGNLSEITMGYFTKWGDGASDFNPIADLTATEVKEFLAYLNAPREIIEKEPSAGLYEGQTDEGDMGITYVELDAYIRTGIATEHVAKAVNRASEITAHKREPIMTYRGKSC